MPALAVGNALIVIVAVPVIELVQVPLETETRLIVCATVAPVTVTVAVPPAEIVAVVLAHHSSYKLLRCPQCQ